MLQKPRKKTKYREFDSMTLAAMASRLEETRQSLYHQLLIGSDEFAAFGPVIKSLRQSAAVKKLNIRQESLF